MTGRLAAGPVAPALVPTGCGDDNSDSNSAAEFDSTTDRDDLPGPGVGDHWHSAFASNICGAEQQPLADAGSDAAGIHSHGDGLIHSHLVEDSYAEENATLGLFFDEVGLQVDEDRTAAGGVEVADQDCDGQTARVAVAWWRNAEDAAGGAEPDEVFTENFDDIRLVVDSEAYTGLPARGRAHPAAGECRPGRQPERRVASAPTRKSAHVSTALDAAGGVLLLAEWARHFAASCVLASDAEWLADTRPYLRAGALVVRPPNDRAVLPAGCRRSRRPRPSGWARQARRPASLRATTPVRHNRAVNWKTHH